MRSLSAQPKLRLVLLILALAFALAYVTDYVIVRKYLPTVSNIFAVQPDLVAFALTIHLPKVGVVSMFCVPFLTFFLLLFPYRTLFDRQGWRGFGSELGRFAGALFLLPLSLVVGAFVFKLVKDSVNLPKAVVTVAESFGIDQTYYVFEHKLTEKISGSLASILGLLIAVWLLKKYVLKKT